MKSKIMLAMIIFVVLAKLNGVKIDAAQPQPGSTVGQAVPAPPALVCASAASAGDPLCRELEAQILATTVRIELMDWREIKDRRRSTVPGVRAHATIKDGRYLVTHNHFNPPLKGGHYSGLSLYTAGGQVIMLQASLTAFTVVAEDAETLALEFMDENGRGLFEALGLPSAEFASTETLALQPGSELAQIDWVGNATQVQWVRLDKIIRDGGTPHIEMRSLIRQGSSGGGVFWQGKHVANNWFRVTTRDGNGRDVVDGYSTAALNSPVIDTLDSDYERFSWSASSLVRLP